MFDQRGSVAKAGAESVERRLAKWRHIGEAGTAAPKHRPCSQWREEQLGWLPQSTSLALPGQLRSQSSQLDPLFRFSDTNPSFLFHWLGPLRGPAHGESTAGLDWRPRHSTAHLTSTFLSEALGTNLTTCSSGVAAARGRNGTHSPASIPNSLRRIILHTSTQNTSTHLLTLASKTPHSPDDRMIAACESSRQGGRHAEQLFEL